MKLSLVAAFVVGVVLIFNVFPSPTEALPADVQMWGVGEVIIWLQDEGFGEDVIQVFHRNDIDGRKLLLLSVEDMQEMKVFSPFALEKCLIIPSQISSPEPTRN